MKSNECHQFQLKAKYLKSDLIEYGLADPKQLSIEDLEFNVVRKQNKEEIKKILKFIRKYEWLGKENQNWNYCFTLTFNGKIVAVVMIGCPAMFSKVLGEETKKYEQVIHRGASCSIAPYNSGSYLISKAIDWMVRHTPYRVFYGYSTPEGANEWGYIYQALNFILISTKAGTRLEFLKPGTKNHWIFDRALRKVSFYRKIAKELKITWKRDWNTKWKIHWENIPEDTLLKLKEAHDAKLKTLTFRKVSPKFKYMLIKGIDKRETKALKKLFKEKNPSLINKDGSIGLPFPKKDKVCKNLAFKNKGVENDSKLQ